MPATNRKERAQNGPGHCTPSSSSTSCSKHPQHPALPGHWGWHPDCPVLGASTTANTSPLWKGLSPGCHLFITSQHVPRLRHSEWCSEHTKAATQGQRAAAIRLGAIQITRALLMTANASLHSLSRVKYSFCTVWVRNSSEDDAHQVHLNHLAKWMRNYGSKVH